MPGLFLSLEGIDGSGKSTQGRLLAEALRALGHVVTLTREPGGSAGAEEIRRLVLEGDPDRWSAETEILLFTAARRDHLEKSLSRATARRGHEMRFEDMGLEFQTRARAGFLDLARAHPDRFRVIDAAPDAETVAQAVRVAVLDALT